MKSMAKGRKWMGGNQKGIALIFTVFVVIGISMILANDFLKGIRQERMVGRAIKRIQAKGIENFIADRGVRLLKDYVQATGAFPGGTGATQIFASQAVPNLGLASGDTFQAKLATELSDWKTRMTTDAGRTIPWLANMTIQPLVAGGTGVDFICSKQESGTSREYLLTFSILHADTGAQQRIAQKVLVNIGKLYDYSIFYSGDLEIQAANDMTLYGPIYAAGDVYLATGHGRTLTITTPPTSEGSAWTEPYALQSSGNIYYGPKRTIAKNYFLNDAAGDCSFSDANCRNPKYAKGLREELRTQDSDYYDPASRVEVNPDYWYRGNQVAFRQWVDIVKSGVESATPEVKNPLPPYFYYFMNEMYYDGGTTHAVRITDKDNNLLVNFSAPSRNYFSSPTQSTAGATSYINLSRTYYTKLSEYTENLSISSAFDPNDPPQLVAGAETGSDRKPVTNPHWSGVGNKVVWDNAPTTGAGTLATKSIITGDVGSTSGAHLIIDPIVGGDSDLVRAKKIQSKTNIRVLCTNDTCTTYGFETWKKAADGVTFSPDLPFSAGSLPSGITRSTLPDYRLGRATPLNAFVVNVGGVGGVAAYAAGRALTTDNTLAIYVQTATGPYSMDATDYTALVKVFNGVQLPQGGFTLASNGRVWVQGDFNMYDYAKSGACTAGQWNYGVWDFVPTCTVPPAAIFCDSFGVLSNEWNAHSGSGLSLDARQVSTNVYINAAVITGTVPSQLVKAYSGCTGGAAGGGAVDFTGCSYGESTYHSDGVQQQARVANAGTYWKPLKSYSDTSGPGLEFSCPNGLAADGNPNNLLTCDYRLDNTTGIYYYNRSFNDGVDNFFARYGAVSNDIPLFGAAEAPYTKTAANPYEAEINFRKNNMNALNTFPDGPLPGSSVFPGMSSAWTLSRRYLYYGTPNYLSGGIPSVTVSATSPETVPLTFNPDSGAASVAQTFVGAAYLGDFGYMPLWVPMYNGGLENLINLQEKWGSGRALFFRGSLLCLWDSENLKVGSGDGTPAFYRTSYYSAPLRDYRFDKSLRTTPPPASPDVIEVKLGDRWY